MKDHHQQLDELLSAQEATWTGPGWKRHAATLGRIALILALLYLLVYAGCGFTRTTAVMTEARNTQSDAANGHLGFSQGALLKEGLDPHAPCSTPPT